MALTAKETSLLNKIQKGMDDPGEGWLHEFIVESMSTTKGVAGSLVKKGLITCYEDPDGGSWAALTEAGKKALAESEL